ncbi:MAG TPA: NAD-dependent epimerase/dehydratase family protein [Ktedonobacteraceae bacterium]|nr:NAD-dependent epimerase/dehydratase family protein [Ktedonobacteraceae bacterium]
MSIESKKRVVVAGATGNIGKTLCKRLIERGYDLVVFS